MEIKWNPHALRHACGLHLINQGADLRTVQQGPGYRRVYDADFLTQLFRSEPRIAHIPEGRASPLQKITKRTEASARLIERFLPRPLYRYSYSTFSSRRGSTAHCAPLRATEVATNTLTLSINLHFSLYLLIILLTVCW